MRAVIQRVSSASVVIRAQRPVAAMLMAKTASNIERGLLILLGIEEADTAEDIEWLSGKIVRLRVFNDEAGVMNRSIQEVSGELLVVSQFTLFASTKKGNRPSYIRAAPPELAIPLYQQFLQNLAEQFGKPVKTGEFGADMQVSLVNDGPVTILIDSRNRE
ncbi:MAG TPA: D-aminoacyl-tRNA deacylase [Verrucomicrobiae bacterium]|nr:D-aminoacyl-tRNA deacylase [Verrucomicrobiae bacterium]